MKLCRIRSAFLHCGLSVLLCACCAVGFVASFPFDCHAWSLRVPDLGDRLWLFNILSKKQEDPEWLQCEDLVDEAESALDRDDYPAALKFLQDYEAVPCTRESVDILVWRYLGVLHAFGYGTEKNVDLGIQYLTKGAEKKNSEAQYGLGLLLIVEQADIQNGIFWMESAAEQGHTKACYDLGKSYSNEETPIYSLEKAAKYYAMGAERGHIDCSQKLADMYYEGQGVGKNLEKARELYTFAAERGNADAAYMLSWTLLHDYESSTKNTEEAYLWLETAKYFNTELYDEGDLEGCFEEELSHESRAKMDKKLERVVSLITLRTQK